MDTVLIEIVAATRVQVSSSSSGSSRVGWL